MVLPAVDAVNDSKNLTLAEQAEIFHDHVRIASKREFFKIQKVLENFDCTDGLVPGKICVGDLCVLCMKIAAEYFKNEEDFEYLVPSETALSLFQLVRVRGMKSLNIFRARFCSEVNR